MQPLLRELDARSIPSMVWNTADGCLVPDDPPPPGTLFLCRQSPSAGCRGNGASLPYAKALLEWLESHGAMVLNGTRALAVETSKCLQLQILRAAGLNTPWTLVCQGLGRLRRQAAALPTGMAVIIKPNVGGSGKGISAFPEGRDAARAAGTMDPADSPDGLWLLQDHLGPYSADDTVMRSIIRVEVVGGAVQRDYFLQITAPITCFGLCPCDPRASKLLASMNFVVLRDASKIPGLGAPGALDTFCKKIEAAFAAAGSVLGSVEAMVLPPDDPRIPGLLAPNEPVVFDFNTCNTNYNERAEAAAGFKPGVARVCDMLQDVMAIMRAGEPGEHREPEEPGPRHGLGPAEPKDTKDTDDDTEDYVCTDAPQPQPVYASQPALVVPAPAVTPPVAIAAAGLQPSLWSDVEL